MFLEGLNSQPSSPDALLLTAWRRFSRAGRRPILTDLIVREIVQHVGVGTVLFIDLEDAGVLLIRGRKDSCGFTRQENCGVGSFAVIHASDEKHSVGIDRLTNLGAGRPQMGFVFAREGID